MQEARSTRKKQQQPRASVKERTSRSSVAPPGHVPFILPGAAVENKVSIFLARCGPASVVVAETGAPGEGRRTANARIHHVRCSTSERGFSRALLPPTRTRKHALARVKTRACFKVAPLSKFRARSFSESTGGRGREAPTRRRDMGRVLLGRVDVCIL